MDFFGKKIKQTKENFASAASSAHDDPVLLVLVLVLVLVVVVVVVIVVVYA